MDKKQSVATSSNTGSINVLVLQAPRQNSEKGGAMNAREARKNCYRKPRLLILKPACRLSSGAGSRKLLNPRKRFYLGTFTLTRHCFERGKFFVHAVFARSNDQLLWSLFQAHKCAPPKVGDHNNIIKKGGQLPPRAPLATRLYSTIKTVDVS